MTGELQAVKCLNIFTNQALKTGNFQTHHVSSQTRHASFSKPHRAGQKMFSYAMINNVIIKLVLNTAILLKEIKDLMNNYCFLRL